MKKIVFSVFSTTSSPASYPIKYCEGRSWAVNFAIMELFSYVVQGENANQVVLSKKFC
jgi:hypothetical protein